MAEYVCYILHDHIFVRLQLKPLLSRIPPDVQKTRAVYVDVEDVHRKVKAVPSDHGRRDSELAGADWRTRRVTIATVTRAGASAKKLSE